MAIRKVIMTIDAVYEKMLESAKEEHEIVVQDFEKSRINVQIENRQYYALDLQKRLNEERGRWAKQRSDIEKEHKEIVEKSRRSPIRVSVDSSNWFFDGDIYDVLKLRDVDTLSEEQIGLEIREFAEKQRRKFERLREKHAEMPEDFVSEDEPDIECSTFGCVYVLINPAMPGLVKIGHSARSPEDRANELSIATGVPSPFVVAFEEKLERFVEAERLIHERLELNRHPGNREFFRMSVKDAIQVVIQIAGALRTQSQDEST